MLHLEELRKKKGLTLSEVARAMNISRQSYSYYETNKRDPDTAMVKALAEFYGVTTDYLLGRDEPVPKRLLNDPEVQEIASLYDKLPEDKKALVLAMTRALASD